MAIAMRDLWVAAAPGVELCASVTADDAGPVGTVPVVLLHGLSQQRRFWGPVLSRLRSRPVAMLDQRGHGDSDVPASADFSVDACATDVVALLDVLAWPRAVVVGHSWGASVALHAAAAHPDRVVAAALIDGGLRALADLGPRDEVRRRLTPPALGIPEDDLWALIRGGDLGPTWSEETRAALAPTFVADDAGQLRTRLGLERHMRVLDGLLDYDPRPDLAACDAAGVPVWAAACGTPPPVPGIGVHIWAGAVHDVPLQWPALVAGFVDALVESGEGQ